MGGSLNGFWEDGSNKQAVKTLIDWYNALPNQPHINFSDDLASNMRHLQDNLGAYTAVKFGDEFPYPWEGADTIPKDYDKTVKELHDSHRFLYFPIADKDHIRRHLATLAEDSNLPEEIRHAATSGIYSAIESFSQNIPFGWESERYHRRYNGEDYSCAATFNIDAMLTYTRATFKDVHQQEVYYFFVSYVGVSYPIHVRPRSGHQTGSSGAG